ncbi:hypothetical protein VP01_2779g1 [Puccinia sorghi]|uniref:Uncharacterized protein n=1 Tax=Puccinia sorghi TaxID=27349 RepID=A0A0L6V2S2_9BASI|nr:hypothetical protein VP01_2779g1 [Puccinia sorghi]
MGSQVSLWLASGADEKKTNKWHNLVGLCHPYRPLGKYNFSSMWVQFPPFELLVCVSVCSVKNLKSPMLNDSVVELNYNYLHKVEIVELDSNTSYNQLHPEFNLTFNVLQPNIPECHGKIPGECEVYTLNVHQSLVESILEKCWSKNRSFLWVSACQLQAHSIKLLAANGFCLCCYTSNATALAAKNPAMLHFLYWVFIYPLSNLYLDWVFIYPYPLDGSGQEVLLMKTLSFITFDISNLIRPTHQNITTPSTEKYMFGNVFKLGHLDLLLCHFSYPNTSFLPEHSTTPPHPIFRVSSSLLTSLLPLFFSSHHYILPPIFLILNL